MQACNDCCIRLFDRFCMSQHISHKCADSACERKVIVQVTLTDVDSAKGHMCVTVPPQLKDISTSQK